MLYFNRSLLFVGFSCGLPGDLISCYDSLRKFIVECLCVVNLQSAGLLNTEPGGVSSHATIVSMIRYI